MRVFVCGPYSTRDGKSVDVMEILANMRAGIAKSSRLMFEGYEPFCPWLDYLLAIVGVSAYHLEKEDFYRYSISWLKVSEAVLTMEGWEKSTGCVEEVKIAKELGIPVFHRFYDLHSYALKIGKVKP